MGGRFFVKMKRRILPFQAQELGGCSRVVVVLDPGSSCLAQTRVGGISNNVSTWPDTPHSPLDCYLRLRPGRIPQGLSADRSHCAAPIHDHVQADTQARKTPLRARTRPNRPPPPSLASPVLLHQAPDLASRTPER